MTERGPAPEQRPTGATIERSPRAARNARRSRLREHNALLNPLPVVGAALATFLAIFVLLVARVATGTDPAIPQSPTAAVSTVRGGSAAALRTTASGASASAAAETAPAAGGGSAQPAAITTRTSGGGRGEGGDDD